MDLTRGDIAAEELQKLQQMASRHAPLTSSAIPLAHVEEEVEEDVEEDVEEEAGPNSVEIRQVEADPYKQLHYVLSQIRHLKEHKETLLDEQAELKVALEERLYAINSPSQRVKALDRQLKELKLEKQSAAKGEASLREKIQDTRMRFGKQRSVNDGLENEIQGRETHGRELREKIADL